MSETLTAPAPIPQQDAPDPDAQLNDALQAQSEFNEDSLEKQLNWGLIDSTSGVDPGARDRADAHINEKTRTRSPEELPEGHAARIWEGAKGLGRRIWYGNIARDYIRTRTMQRSRQEIIAQENTLLYKGGSKEDYDRSMEAVVNRFTNDWIHEGENKHALGATERGAATEQAINELISSYAAGTIGHEELVDEKKRLVAEFGRSVRSEDRKKGILYADNIISVAQNARTAFEHGVGLDRIETYIKGFGGEARLGARTEARRDATDKVMDTLYKSKVGAVIGNETFVAAAAATVITVGKFTTRKVLSAALVPLSLGASTAVVAGLRERLHVGQNRQTNAREMAEGGEINPENNKRRERYEATRYQTISARELTNSMSVVTELLTADSSNFGAALDALVQAHTRITKSDRENIDLIHFTDARSIEEERFALDDRKAALTTAAERTLGELDDAALAAAGLTSRDINEVLRVRSADVETMINTDITAKDAAFNSLRRKQVAKMAACAFVGGETLGLATQEVRAEFSDRVQGVFESNSDASTRRTLLAGIFHRGTSHGVIGAEHGVGQALNDHTNVALPPGYHLTEAKDGAWNLTQGHDKVIGQVGFDGSGHLNDASKQLLEQKGFLLTDHTEPTTATHTVSETVQRTPADYINQHPEKFTTLNRQLWYANNTPAPNFDKNELDLWWGGQGNTGIDAHGNYVFNVAHMTPDGSYEGGLSANAIELARAGKLSVALSFTQGTQQHVYMMRIGADGNAIIAHNDPIGQSLFQNQNGHAQFLGAYAEVVQNAGVNPNGSENVNILATFGGANDPRPVADVLHHVVTTHGEHVFTTIDAPAVAETPIEVPFVVPIAGRRGLEGLKKSVGRNPNLSSLYYSGRSLEELQRWLAEDPTRLHSRHEVVEADGTKRWVEADGSIVERDLDRERANISAYLEKEKSRNPDHYRVVEEVANFMPPMTNECRVSVNIPAWMEEKNLSNLLEQYTAQVNVEGTPLKPELYEINILVNRKTGSAPDNSVGVINEFAAKFEAQHGIKPNVNYYDVQLDPPYNNVGYARKLLTDAVVMRSVRRDGQAAPLYIETEDADLMHIDPRTVANLIDKFDKNPQLDGLRGMQDRAPEYLQRNDMLFLKRRAADFFEVLVRQKKFRDPTHPNWDFTWNRTITGGWNTGYTAEAYALIEGYDPSDLGEDMSIGERLTMVRGDGKLPNLEVVGKVASRTDSSPRRFINEILTDRSAYQEFTDEKDNQDIRERSLDEALGLISHYERISGDNVKDFDNMIKGQAGWIYGVSPTARDAEQVIKRLLFFLGFSKGDYELKDGQLEVKSWNNVETALQKYRNRYQAKLALGS